MNFKYVPSLEEAKKVIDEDWMTVAFIFKTVHGIPLEIFLDWAKKDNLTYLGMAKKCAYWRDKMPKYFKPIPWEN